MSYFIAKVEERNGEYQSEDIFMVEAPNAKAAEERVIDLLKHEWRGKAQAQVGSTELGSIFYFFGGEISGRLREITQIEKSTALDLKLKGILPLYHA